MPETIDNFFNTRLVNYASYDNLRKIASCIDGLKNASRKVMYTVLEKNIKDNVKAWGFKRCMYYTGSGFQRY